MPRPDPGNPPPHRAATLLALLVALAVLGASTARSAPRQLLSDGVRSPDGTYSANVEWDDAGFIGLLKMRILGRDGVTRRLVQVPEINPSPANLMWLDNEWVACDSFIGDNGSGFFYVHAPTGRGYLIEIVAPKIEGDWVFAVASTDSPSTGSIGNISRGRSSLFPIQLREVPLSEKEYFTADFCRRVVDAVDAYNAFRRSQKFRQMDILSAADIRPELGAIFLAQVDGRAEAVYFPAGAATPSEMFARVRRVPLPEPIQVLADKPGGADLRVRWEIGGGFLVESVPAPDSGETGPPRALARGKLEGISDKPVPQETQPAARNVRRPSFTPAPMDSDEHPESGGDEDEATTPTNAPKPKITPAIYVSPGKAPSGEAKADRARKPGGAKKPSASR